MPKRFFLLALLWLPIALRIAAQPVGSDDAVSIYKDIRRLGVLASVLYVAAHPDDENTRMISFLSNHLGVRTTYLSLTRGDGGQNLIGPEIREMLGIIRTHELLSARAIDGGYQRFTRANDFGYSKTPAETFNFWNRREVLADVIWTIRQTRPDIIINRFSTDTSRPNHGHHTASAILASEAFDLAGKADVFPEQMAYTSAWQPRRIFWNTSWWFYGSREAFEKADKSKMLAIDIGAYDPLTGESNSEIAGRSRSMHKSQGFGSAETRGESLDYIDLLKDARGTVPKELFEGIDISWSRVTGGAPIGEMVRRLEAAFDFRAPTGSLPLLLEIHKAIQALPNSWWRTVKMEECESIIRKCLGLFMEARTDRFQVSPGQPLDIAVEIINRSPAEVSLTGIARNGQPLDTTRQSLSFNKGITRSLRLHAPDNLSIPYWLAETPDIGMYKVADPSRRGLPADDPAILLDISVSVNGQTLGYRQPVVYKTVDPAEGEITRPVSVTPPIAIAVGAESLVFREGEARTIPVTLTAMQDSVSGKFSVAIEGSGWSVTPPESLVTFSKSGESTTIDIRILPPKKAGKAILKSLVLVDGKKYAHKVTVLDYEHLPLMSVVSGAAVKLEAADIATTPRRIAYIRGAGDDVPAALAQIGYDVRMLAPETISPQVLSEVDVVITGVRAFNTVDALAFKNKILFDWLRDGGTMIVQYNVSGGLVTNEIAPLSLTLSRDRVTEENAPVTVLRPDHPALRYPNKIDDDDFQGWTQERGLYFPKEWDPAFVPLLSMQDTGEKPSEGSLLVAPVGKGFYVYSGLSWFRHLPAGNTGAYRLLSNLIALGYTAGKP